LLSSFPLRGAAEIKIIPGKMLEVKKVVEDKASRRIRRSSDRTIDSI
jgi:hypothetical protein